MNVARATARRAPPSAGTTHSTSSQTVAPRPFTAIHASSRDQRGHCQKWARGMSATRRESEPSRATIVRARRPSSARTSRDAAAIVTDVAASHGPDDRPGQSAQGGDFPERALAARGLRRREVDECARIRRPSRMQVIEFVPGDLKRRASSQKPNPHLSPAVHRGDERDHLAIGRDRGRPVRSPLHRSAAGTRHGGGQSRTTDSAVSAGGGTR